MTAENCMYDISKKKTDISYVQLLTKKELGREFVRHP